MPDGRKTKALREALGDKAKEEKKILFGIAVTH
jgi:hypothetical protein